MRLESTITERAGFLYITPLFDGVLLVLVFFVFSSNIVSKSGVAVALPTSNSTVKNSKATHVITIIEGAPPKIYFNESRVDMAQLTQKLQAKKSAANHVTILADEGSSYGAVMEVALVALRYNFEVAFATQPDQK